MRRQGAVALALACVSGAAWAEELRIAALGDSLTQGFGLVEQDGLVPQLQAWLEDHGVAEVVLINAGVSGDTTAGGLARIGWTLDGQTDGLILALGGNDMLRGIDPAVSRANLAGILDAAGAADVPVLLVGFEAAGNFGPDFKAAFDGMYPDLAAAHGAQLHPSLLRPVASETGPTPLNPALMQPDGIHPNAEGVARIAAALGPAVAELVETIRTRP